MAFTGTLPATSRRPRIPALLTRIGTSGVDHLKTTASRLSGSVLTIAGLGCVDVGAFTANTIAGWVTTGITVLLLDWKIE